MIINKDYGSLKPREKKIYLHFKPNCSELQLFSYSSFPLEEEGPEIVLTENELKSLLNFI